MLHAGEDSNYLLRRLTRMAAEAIGLADLEALQMASAASAGFDLVGRPEGDLLLAELAVYLATVPKSNAVYIAFGAVQQEIARGAVHTVPSHLRHAATPFMRELGWGRVTFAGIRPNDMPMFFLAQLIGTPVGWLALQIFPKASGGPS
jgi:putative ATPase